MTQVSLAFMTVLLFTAGPSMVQAAPSTSVIENLQKATACEKSYEFIVSLVSYSARDAESPVRAKELSRQADELEAKQHQIEKTVDASKIDGMSKKELSGLVRELREDAEIRAASRLESAVGGDLEPLIQRLNQNCAEFIKRP